MASIEEGLIAKLADRTAVIGIYGLGYVGLPLALRYTEVGYKVVGFDVDPTKIETLANGESYIGHIAPERIEALNQAGFEGTLDFARSSEVDALILCVPTPLDAHREPDMRYVVGTVDAIAPHLRAGQILVLESTVYPGATEETLRPAVEARGFTVGEDLFLAYSPEREDPGNVRFDTVNIPKVLGGVTPACGRVGAALYAQAIETVVPVSSARTAEMTKLLENIHRAVNIGLVNEMKIVADKMGVDIFEVIQAAATKPFGFTPYYPGPGIGGHCIPVDPFYLTWKAREYGVHTRFIELAGEVNSGMPRWVMDKITEALNARGKAVKDARVLMLGIAFKKNVDDCRESPAVEVMELLRDRGAALLYSDPHVPRFPEMRKHAFDLESRAVTRDLLEGLDAVVLGTDHDAFDYVEIAAHAPLIIDTRGRFDPEAENVVRA